MIVGKGGAEGKFLFPKRYQVNAYGNLRAVCLSLRPQAQGVDVHVANPDYVGGVWAVVDFDVTPYLGKAVRFNATLPENLLQRIDEKVKRDHRYASRSGFLASAALRELATAH